MRLIQCGLGGMGAHWIRTVRDQSEFEIAAFVEINPETARWRAEEFDLDPKRIYLSLEAALASVEADAVLDITPPNAHRPVAFTALDAGLPVLAEKPLAGTRADAEAIVEKSSRTGVLHMVAQNYRYSPVAQTVRRALDASDLGAVGAVSVRFFKGPHFGGFREIMAHPLIVDMAIHHFDLMRFFLGDSPVEIYARSWNPPWSWFQGDASAAVTARFESGAVVSYTGSWCSQGQETPWNADWRFECADGVLTLQEDQIYVQRRGQTEREEILPLKMERQAQAYLLHEFYQAVTTGTTPATTCQDNLNTTNFVFDVVQSCATGEVVRRAQHR
ncbi:MAG: Gfo/Idh/MocA family oxidoreductase [Anaerolineae bacterium]|nr:Gfo/Idh/MocA family oxidoreductase [Anaerolineae bacterium]NUQ05907.1 Gfo/Idh/MocA family oxidoreductase [Anaerolineae bacterium]